MEKAKEEYVLPKLKHCYSTIASFDLWMSKGAHDVFASVISKMATSTYYNRIV